MKYDFDGEELNVILMSLIGRMRTVQNLLDVPAVSDPSYISSYKSELKTVEDLLEKFFPGSVERIKASYAA